MRRMHRSLADCVCRQEEGLLITLVMSTKTYLALANEDGNHSVVCTESAQIEFDDALDYGTIIVKQNESKIMKIN